jgi:peptide/nickel transport system ATP-binding protein
MKRLNVERGTGMIFITHDLDVARFLCHRIAVMYFGRLIEIGPTAEILSAPRHPYTAHLLGASPGSMEPLDETTLDPRGMEPSSCNYRDRCPRRLALCATSRPDVDGGAACFNPLSGSIDRRLSPAA